MTALDTEHPAAVRVDRVPTRPTNLAQQSWIMVKRNMIHTKRMPEMLSDVTAQPIMFVLLFAFVFGASITNTGGALIGWAIGAVASSRGVEPPRSLGCVNPLTERAARPVGGRSLEVRK